MKEYQCFGQKPANCLSKPCQAMDPVWRKRKRVIDTRLLVAFILKLVLSRNRQGIDLHGMWVRRLSWTGLYGDSETCRGIQVG